MKNISEQSTPHVPLLPSYLTGTKQSLFARIGQKVARKFGSFV